MKKYYIMIFILISSFFGSVNIENQLLSNEEYITGEDGVIRMYVNIIGHVKNPGIYLVYDGIDYMSILSAAGGYLSGSDLKNVTIFSKDGSKRKINLSKIFNNSDLSYNVFAKLKPHDTIYIEEKNLSKIFNSSNLPSVLLSILNIALTLERTQD